MPSDDYRVVRAAMTADVQATTDWLLDQGFQITEARSGGMASALLRLRRDDLDVIITRDRGQWMLDFHLDGDDFDLGAVHSARVDRREWPTAARALPAQVPDDVEWRSEVEASLEWIRSTDDAIARVQATRRRRSTALWG